MKNYVFAICFLMFIQTSWAGSITCNTLEDTTRKYITIENVTTTYRQGTRTSRATRQFFYYGDEKKAYPLFAKQLKKVIGDVPQFRERLDKIEKAEGSGKGVMISGIVFLSAILLTIISPVLKGLFFATIFVSFFWFFIGAIGSGLRRIKRLKKLGDNCNKLVNDYNKYVDKLQRK